MTTEAGRPTRGDAAAALAVAALAAVETVLWPSMDGQAVVVGSVALAALSAATVAGRRAWPLWSSLACAGVFLLGVALSVPVYPGLWFLVTVCGLLWTVTAVAARSEAAVAVTVLAASVLLEVWLTEPHNVPFDAVVMGVAVTAGLLTRLARSRALAAEGRALEAGAEISAAARGAVEAERSTFARELHDTVSHAVGLIAVQSAAAMVSWQHDPAAARAHLALVDRAAESALSDLDHACVGAPPERTGADLGALVERIRAAGTPVRLDITPPAAAPLPDPVYRVVQEALTNVVRHAPGARATVRVATDAGRVVVEVIDDGPGMDASAERGYGLVGLAERVRFAGGTLTTSGGPDDVGLRVTAELPTGRRVTA